MPDGPTISPLGPQFETMPQAAFGEQSRLQEAAQAANSFDNIAKSYQLGYGLADLAWNRQLAMEKGQADLQEVLSRGDYTEAATRNLQTEADQRSQLLPLDLKAKQLDLDTKQLNLDSLNSQYDDQTDALAKVKTAMGNLPKFDDPDYQRKIDGWLSDNTALLSRTDDAGKQLQTAYGLVSGRAKATSAFNDKLSQIQEFNTLKAAGYIPSPMDADAQVFGNRAQPQLVQGRMLKNQDQVQQLLSDPRLPAAYRGPLQDIHDYLHSFVASDTGANDVMVAKASKFVDTNGNLNASAQGVLNAVNASLGQKPAEYEATIPLPKELGLPPIRPGEPAQYKVKGTAAQIQEALTPVEQAQQRQAISAAIQKGMPNTPENQADMALYQRGQIDINELTNRINQRARPTTPAAPRGPGAGVLAPGGGAGTSSGTSGGWGPSSNNNYSPPLGATDVGGINRHVWANVMSEEGPEFGKDGSHDSVFGLWADAPGAEGAGYAAVRAAGVRSPEAFHAVANAWNQAFLQPSRPWELRSPGMQELVIADSQHRGGEAARRIINEMGGYDAVNQMDPREAITQYSELRKPLWPGNNRPFPDGASDRVSRERAWALRHAELA